MTITSEFIDNLINNLLLSEIVSKYVKLTKKGNRFSGLCPFHSEKTPSFYVNDIDGFFYCFGCGSGGNVINFVRKIEGTEFTETVRILSEKAGMQIPSANIEDKKKFLDKQNNFHILSEAQKFFQHSFHNVKDKMVLDFLKDREIKNEMIEIFKIGYAPSSGLTKTLKSKGFEEKKLQLLGLSSKATDDNSYYDYFRRRIIFPIENRKGEVIAFGGRSIDNKLPKYVNSPETPTFSKKNVLYGWNQAKEGVGKGLPLLVVEGYIDVIAITSTNIAASVAPLGTALTESQITHIWKLHKDPILLFDGDQAGQKALVRAIEKIFPLLEPSKSVRIGVLPIGMDPDDLLREMGNKALQKIISNSKSLMQCLWDLNINLFEVYSPDAQPNNKAIFWEYLKKTVSTIKHHQTRLAFRDDLDVRINAMRANDKKRFFVIGKQRPKTGKIIKEKAILALLISFPSLFNDREEKLISFTIMNIKLEKLKKSLVKYYLDYPDCSTADIISHLEENGFSNELKSIFSIDMQTRFGEKLENYSHDQARFKFDELLKLSKL